MAESRSMSSLFLTSRPLEVSSTSATGMECGYAEAVQNSCVREVRKEETFTTPCSCTSIPKVSVAATADRFACELPPSPLRRSDDLHCAPSYSCSYSQTRCLYTLLAPLNTIAYAMLAITSCQPCTWPQRLIPLPPLALPTAPRSPRFPTFLRLMSVKLRPTWCPVPLLLYFGILLSSTRSSGTQTPTFFSHYELRAGLSRVWLKRNCHVMSRSAVIPWASHSACFTLQEGL